jgi:putative hydrolase of the HAD superfamily
MKIKAILFDVGGVLCGNLSGNIYSSLSKLSKDKLSYRTVKKRIDQYENMFEEGKITPIEFEKRVADKLGIENYYKIIELYKTAVIKKGQVNKDVKKLAEELKKKGYKTGLLSNTCKIHADVHKKRGDYNGFSPLVLSYIIGYRKPRKEIYIIALRKLKIKPEECIFIDNKKWNLEPAMRLGIKTILFKSPYQLRREMNKLL